MGSDSQTAATSSSNKEKAGRHNKLLQNIEQARNLDEHVDTKDLKANKPILDPLPNKKSKLEPLDKAPKTDLDDFDFSGLDTSVKKDDKKKDDVINDDYDFDFDFEDVPKKGNKPAEVSSSKPEEKKKEEKPKEAPKETVKVPEKEGQKDQGPEDKEEEEYIVIDGKRFREIQIEGEEDEYLMDDDGNIYDKEGQYIGTAKDGGDEGEETEEEK